MLARTRRGRFGLRLLLLSLIPIPAYAGVGDLPFELRLLFAVDRQSNYSSTLARQASIAALDGASANPGAASYREVQEPTTTLTASGVYAPSSGGRDVYAAPLAMRWQDPDVGTLAFAYAYTDTRNAAGDDGLVHSLRSDEFLFGYGRHIAAQVSAGLSLRLTSGTIANDSHAAALGGVPVRSHTRLLSPDASLGVAAQLTSSISVGFALGYSRARADNTVSNLTPFPMPIAQDIAITVPAGTVIQVTDDTVSTSTVRMGIGWHPDTATAVYLDVVGLRVASDAFGSGSLARVAAGAEHRFEDRWKVLGGVSVDSTGNVTWSGGFDYSVGSFDAQLAVQGNAAPEVNKELGRTTLVSASLGWRF